MLIKYPNSILRTKTNNISEITEQLQAKISEMFFIIQRERGAGLAAPQIGEASSFFVVRTEREDYVFINPVILEKEGEQSFEEGCLSIPGITETIKRAKRVVIQAQDLTGRTFKLDTRTNVLLAQVIQHEYDHLQGILFIDYFTKEQKLKHRKVLRKLEKDIGEKKKDLKIKKH